MIRIHAVVSEKLFISSVLWTNRFSIGALTFAGLRRECAGLVVAAHSDCVAGTCSSMRPLAMDSCLLDAFRVVAEVIVALASYLFRFQIQFL